MSDKITFGTFGRYTEIPVDQMTPEQKKGDEYVVKERGEAPGPYKIILQNPNLLQVLVPVGRHFQQSHSQSPTSQIPTRAPTMVPTARMIALNAIEPTNCAL